MLEFCVAAPVFIAKWFHKSYLLLLRSIAGGRGPREGYAELMVAGSLGAIRYL